VFDLEWLRGLSLPVLLTMGDQSPPIFAPVIRKLAGMLPPAEVVTLEGAGHIPHATHPEMYVGTIDRFARQHFV
jgi:pimeloyl-ACP methyl ester carboxylesterase